MAAMEETCFFKDMYNCSNDKDKLSKSKRLQTIAKSVVMVCQHSYLKLRTEIM